MVIPDFARIPKDDRDFAEITGEITLLSLSKAVREIRMTSNSDTTKEVAPETPADEQLSKLFNERKGKQSAFKTTCQCESHVSMADFCARRVQMLKNATSISRAEVESLEVLKSLVKRMISSHQFEKAAEFAHAATERVCAMPAQDAVLQGKALIASAEMMELLGHFESASSCFKGAYRLFVKEFGEKHPLTEKAGCSYLQSLRRVGRQYKLERTEKSTVNFCRCDKAPFYKVDPVLFA